MPRIAVCSFRRFGCIPGEQGDAGDVITSMTVNVRFELW